MNAVQHRQHPWNHVKIGCHTAQHGQAEQEAAKQEAAAARVGAAREAAQARPARSNNNRERQRRQRLETLENEIAALEKQLEAISRQLETPPPDAGQVQRLGQEYVRVQHALDEHLEEWSRLSEEVLE